MTCSPTPLDVVLHAMRWARCACIWLLVGGLLAPPGLGAQTVDARRGAAIEAWLSDAELAGLRGLAKLARADDAQAQVLLGLIDRHAALQGPQVLALSRAERIALLRAPGGLSGRNWLARAAAQGNQTAQAWQALARVPGELGTAERFAALQEPRAVALSLLTLAKRQERGFAPAVMARDWYPETLLFLSPDRTLTRKRAAQLHPGDPQRRYLDGGAPPKQALQAWLDSAPVALHLRATCAAVCPSTPRPCVLALYHALGDYAALVTHGSPVTSLVPDAVLATSPRGRAALARRIMLMRSTRMREAERQKLAGVSRCAADWLAAQFDAHTARKIPGPE